MNEDVSLKDIKWTNIESSFNAENVHTYWKRQPQESWNVKKKHFTNFTAAVFDYLLNIYVVKRKHTHNASLWVPLASVAERGRQGGGAALIVQSGASVIDGWVDGDCPHARGITIAVAVVIATAIPWCPHVDAAFSSAPLKTASLRWSEVKIVIVLCITCGTCMLAWVKWELGIWELHLTVKMQRVLV